MSKVDIIITIILLTPALVVGFMALMVFFWRRSNWRKVARIHTELYGDTAAACVLCPTCRGFVYVGVWKKHLEYYHGLQYVRPIEEDFEKAKQGLPQRLSETVNQQGSGKNATEAPTPSKEKP